MLTAQIDRFEAALKAGAGSDQVLMREENTGRVRFVLGSHQHQSDRQRLFASRIGRMALAAKLVAEIQSNSNEIVVTLGPAAPDSAERAARACFDTLPLSLSIVHQ